MRYPSIKALESAFPDVDAKQIRAIMEGPRLAYVATSDAAQYGNATVIAGTWHRPMTRMARIDVLLGTFGVDVVTRGRNAKSPAFAYCNAGDTYATTILKINGAFRIGCWGDIVERGNYS